MKLSRMPVQVVPLTLSPLTKGERMAVQTGMVCTMTTLLATEV